MKICKGMLVKDVFAELNQKFLIGHIGRPGVVVQNFPKSKKKMLHARKDAIFEVTENTRFCDLATLCSWSLCNPIKFVNLSIGLIKPEWTLKEYQTRCDHKHLLGQPDKMSMVLKLAISSETFSDFDWLMRSIKRAKIPYNLDFDKQLFSAIIKNEGILTHEQKIILHGKLINELVRFK